MKLSEINHCQFNRLKRTGLVIEKSIYAGLTLVPLLTIIGLIITGRSK